MEGTEQAQPVHLCNLDRIVYQSCRVFMDVEVTERAQRLFTFVITGLFTSLVGCIGHGRD